MPNLNRHEWASLAAVQQRRADLGRCSEAHRQNLITLGMQDPPLVEVDGPLCFINEAGKAALAARGGGR
jgi:hypothetical protein